MPDLCRIRHLVIAAALLLASSAASAQTYLRYTNWCQKGGQPVMTSGIRSLTKVQASYPRCTITVYAAGTLSKSFLFTDKIGTPLANPFTAALDGSFTFYVNSPAHYDIVTSSSAFVVMPAPFTIFDQVITDSGGGGGGGSVNSVGATAPVQSSGGTSPVISLPQATAAQSGYLAAADWATFNGKGAGTVTSIGVTVPATGLSVTPATITNSGNFAIAYNGQFPTTSICSGSPINTSFCNGGGAWLPALTYSGSPVTSLVQGANTALTLVSNALTIASTSAVTFPVAAPEGSQTSAQYSYLLHPEIGGATSIVGSALPIEQIQVTALVGPGNIVATVSSPINPLRWIAGDTFRLTALPASPTDLTSLNGVTFTATSIAFNQTCPNGFAAQSCGTITFSATTTIPVATYVTAVGSASNFEGFLAGHTWGMNRLQSSTTNPSRTGTVQGARRDAWKFRSGAVDDTGIDIAALRGGAQMSPTNGVGTGKMRVNGSHLAGVTSLSINKAAGTSWTATSADYILIDRPNGDADIQRYKITNASISVVQGTNTTVTITPALRTTMLGGELIVASWGRTQLGDGSGAEILGDLTLADLADGCLNITSGLVGSTGLACGAGSAVSGADKDVQLNVSGAFGSDTGIFTYNSGTSTLKVRNVLINGAAAQQSRVTYTVGGVTLTAGGAGTTVWGVDTDGFIKFCENNGACVRPGSGAGSGNVSNSGSPTSGQTAEFITDATHITGVANTGTGSYVKATAATMSLPKLDALNDVNNKSALTLVATTNAVDSFQLTNAATANPATILLSAIGSDSNININIVPKGTGTVLCNGLACGGGGSSYTNLFQSDANTLTQRNSTVTQAYQVMDSYTDAANYQGLQIGGNYVKTVKLGTGAALAFQFGVHGAAFRGWQVTTALNLSPFNNPSGGITSNFLQSSSLLDANGAPFLASSATASAVNSVTIVNSATGQPVQVSATGTDSNISLNLVPKGTGVILCAGSPCGTGGGTGTVTAFASGNLSPLFTTNVTTATTTPTQSFTLISAAANSLFGNPTAASAAPAYFTAALTAAPFGREGTATQVLHGSAAGQFTFGPVNFAADGTGIVPSANLCAGSPTATTFCNGVGQWATPAGGGNLSNSGTPTVGQAAEFVTATTVKGTNVTGTGSFAKATSPLLVGPLVNTILDANGAPFLSSTATAAAVDSITVTNSATGSPATVGLSASGTDANIHLLIGGKGTGLVQFSNSIQTISANAGAWQANEGLDPGLALAGKDLLYANSTNHYWTMSNNGGAAQKVIGSSADLSTTDFVVGAHFPFTRTGDIWIKGASGWTPCAGNNSGTQFLTEDSSGNCAWSPGTSSVAWSSILPPASTSNISMAGFTTAFNYTSALSNAFAWINTTPAVNGTAQSSPTLGIQGNYWGGSSQQDIWQFQNVISNTTNGPSTLAITHAGTPGLALVSAPGFKTTGTSTTPALSSTEGSAPTTLAASDILYADATAHRWMMLNNGGAAIPVVGGPTSAVSANLPSYNGTSGGSLQDSGIAAGQVPTSAAVIVSGNVVQGSGGVRGISDAGFAANTVVTSAAVIAAGNVPAGSGGVRGVVDSNLVAAQINFSAANITTGNLITGAANTRQVQDGGIALANVFHTATKADVTETNMRCSDAGSTDTYACNLSPAITAYVTGTEYGFKANTANTGVATINLNAVGALTIKKLFGGSITSDLADNDIRAGQWVYCVYDGTNCQMTSQIGNQPSSSGTVTSVATSGPITGGTFTTSGTIGCATCATSAASLANNQLAFGAGSQGLAVGDLTGDVTTAGGKATTIAAAAVTGGKIASSVALAGSPTTTTQSAKDNSTKIATTAYVDAPTGLTSGTSVTLSAPRQYFVCTGTCTITVPVPAAGYEFCVLNTDNVATVITMAAIGSSARYENTARTAYGTAGTGTFVSAGAVGDKVCLLGLDSTHYLTVSSTGTWTAN